MALIPQSLRTARGITAAAVATGVCAIVLAGQLVGGGADSAPNTVLTAPVAVAFTAMGAFIVGGMPGSVVGRLMLAAGLVAAVALVSESWVAWTPMAWLSQWSWWPPFALIVIALLQFPDGRLPSAGFRPLAVWTIAASTVAALAFAVAALDHPRTLLTEIDTPLTTRAQILLRVGGAALLASFAGLVGVLWSLVYRWRRADGETRLQLMCLIPAGVLFLVGLALTIHNVPAGWAIGAVAVPIAMTVAVLRYHLYGLDVIISRAVVWFVMSMLVVAGFVAIVTLSRDVVFGGDLTLASLVTTGLIAVGFEPLRRRVQVAVNHLLYGDRDDPYKVVAELGDVVGRTADPDAVLPLLTGTVARSLRLPYVAVELAENGGHRTWAEHGTPSTTVVTFDMVTHGENIGRLLVATRSVSGGFTRRESRLLRDIAMHAAVAADGTRLVRDLRQSRERLVLAREEERRRLRRDLHDGVGPTLAGMAMQVRATRKLLPVDSLASPRLVMLSADLETCQREVRELVNQLGPPALDNGLRAGLSTECQRFTGHGLAVRLHVSGTLDGLPAAVEVAVYRIVAEALTNVTRHAWATECGVTVERGSDLTVRITDDGVGLDGSHRPGVGLDSMLERATELGGTCVIGAGATGGTEVSIRIPLSGPVAT